MNPKLPSGAEADENALAKTAIVRIRDVPLAAISVTFAMCTLSMSKATYRMPSSAMASAFMLLARTAGS